MKLRASNQNNIDTSITITCPQCQSTLSVSPLALSVFCKSCHFRINVPDIINPKKLNESVQEATNPYECFRCQETSQISINSLSYMCRKCGYRNDLQDYKVKSFLSQNIETKGNLEITKKGSVLNSNVIVQNALIYGKFIGNLKAFTVTLFANSSFEGTLDTHYLELFSTKDLKFKKEIQASEISIQEVFKGHIIAQRSTIVLKEKSLVLGHIKASKIIIEKGASFSGSLHICPQ